MKNLKEIKAKQIPSATIAFLGDNVTQRCLNFIKQKARAFKRSFVWKWAIPDCRIHQTSLPLDRHFLTLSVAYTGDNDNKLTKKLSF